MPATGGDRGGTPMRCPLVVLFCVLALLPLAAQQPQQPTFRAGVDVVAVDVQVADSPGPPVVTPGAGARVSPVTGAAMPPVAAASPGSVPSSAPPQAAARTVDEALARVAHYL